MVGSAKADLIHRLEVYDDEEDYTNNGSGNYFGKLRCYDEVVSYFLDTYADESTI